MKVLVISSIFPNNGEQTKGIFIKHQILELAHLCEVKVIAPVPWFLPLKIFRRWYGFSQVSNCETIDGLEVYHPRFLVIPKALRFLYGVFYFIGIYSTVQKIYSSFKFDSILAYFAYPDGFAAGIVAGIMKKHLTIKVLGSDINVFTKGRVRRALTKYSLERADKIIAVSNDLKNKIVDLGILESKITVVTNGFDHSKFFPSDKLQSRKALNIPLDKTVYLFVGNLQRTKGVECLFNAFLKVLNGGNDNIILILVGRGELSKEIEVKIERKGLSSKIQLAGLKPHDEIPLWINACDVLCLPSFNEGCPNVILETLACGKPVLASRVGGIPEIIDSEKYGMLVLPDNISELAEAIQKVYGKEWIAHLLCERVEGMTWTKTASKIFDVLKSIRHKNI